MPEFQYRPRHTGNPSIDEGFKQAFDYLYALKSTSDKLSAQPAPLTINQVRTALQANGTSPLSVQGLAGQLASAQPNVKFGTHAARLAVQASAASGVLWSETDRQGALYCSNGTAWVLILAIGQGYYEARWSDLGMMGAGAWYAETSRSGIAAATPTPLYRWNGTQWVYQSGLWTRIQSTLVGLLATFGVGGSNDIGALARVSDYGHILEAVKPSVYAWQRGPGDSEHSDTFQYYGAAPADVGWHACDGSTVSFLKYDGTLGSRILPNLAAAVAYVKAGNAYAPSVTAAAPPTFTGVGQNFTSASILTAAGNSTVLTGPTSITSAGNVSLAGGDPIPNVELLLYYRQ
jgi:hypothetical protein